MRLCLIEVRVAQFRLRNLRILNPRLHSFGSLSDDSAPLTVLLTPETLHPKPVNAHPHSEIHIPQSFRLADDGPIPWQQILQQQFRNSFIRQIDLQIFADQPDPNTATDIFRGL